MKMTFFAKITRPGKDRVSTPEKIETLEPNENEINIADGGEFLSDAIRMKDQPFEENVLREDE